MTKLLDDLAEVLAYYNDATTQDAVHMAERDALSWMRDNAAEIERNARDAERWRQLDIVLREGGGE